MEDQKKCAHVDVKRERVAADGKKWYCVDCGAEFFPLSVFESPSKITIMEPYATMRDQFAMAAMQGMLASCHGPAWGKDVFPLADSAYAYADQMMEARK
jgi:hypothetical protein